MLQSVTLKEEKRRKGEKRKQERHGETKPDEQGPWLYFQRGLIYLKLCIEDNRGCKIMQSQQSLILIETRLSFLQTYSIQML